MKRRLTFLQRSILLSAVLLILGVTFYAIAHEQLSQKVNISSPVTASANLGELVDGTTVEQKFTINGDKLQSFSLLFQTYSRTNAGHLEINILDGDTSIYTVNVDTATIQDNSYMTFIPALTALSACTLTLRVTSLDGQAGNAITIAYGSNTSVGRGSVNLSIDNPVMLNGKPLDGQLCMTITAEKTLWFGQYYWYFFAGFMLACIGYMLWINRCVTTGRSCLGLRFLAAISRYRFLLQQLVDRDFKTKYKRSVLGVFWSFLNPLLTMLVQYVVFSTLFKSDIPNYPVYLLTGIMCFTYFSETISQCMLSIVGNASLITKVYVPKYIYPLSKSLSSGINLLLSMIPLLLVMLLTGLWPKLAFLLLPFGLICLFVLSLGMGMLMATFMVFFRDTQFLWGVMSMLWMYATPIFYPESIIPEKLMLFYKMNPLYHIIRFCRSVLIDGISPEPKAYLLCLIACFVPLLLGLLVFKWQQDKFILYI
ncbi:hypothetical protein SDC9_60621 [bioreactor metagenome]|uniref:ABC transmembrane type-2 domain-containing protein n=1 Tax=bioreactor metagenome TaxID=1076179 RepID=A0A644XDT8_9ZZZZ